MGMEDASNDTAHLSQLKPVCVHSAVHTPNW